MNKKVELIKYPQSNTGLSVRALGEMFDCGKTQVGKILKNKESLLTMYESNASESRVHTSMTQRHSEFEEMNMQSTLPVVHLSMLKEHLCWRFSASRKLKKWLSS